MARNINTHVSLSCPACGATNAGGETNCLACHEPLPGAGHTRATTNPLTGLLLPDVVIQQRYRILETLSSSEVYTLYKARDLQLGDRVVVLKEIAQQTQNTPPEIQELIEASRREMQLLAGLIHPNLLRIYDYFLEDQRWYFVRDLLAGETLASYLHKRGHQPLSLAEIIDYGIQLSTVLDYLHLRKSPLGLKELALSAIWRSPDGQLYLLDTGTVPQVSAMAENQAVYNLGVILRQLLSGRTRRRKRSSPLRALVRQMVQKKASKRPENLGKVRQELQRIAIQTLPAQTLRSPASVSSRRRFVKRLGRFAGFAGLLAVSGGVTWFFESQLLAIPHPFYHAGPGGTICTYNAGSGVLGVAWSPDGTRLAMGNKQGQVQAWDANTGLHAMSFQAPLMEQAIEAIIWLPDGKAIAAGGDDGLVWVWNAATGKFLYMYRGHTGWIITLACSPDGKYIASGSFDTTVQVWEAATGRAIVTYNGHTSGIGSVTWSPDGRYIASASFDTTVQVWEAATGRPIYTYTGHQDKVYTVAWSPDGQHIASGDRSGSAMVWPVSLFESDQPLNTQLIVPYSQRAFDSSAIQALAWSPDSKYIASVSHDVQIWDSRTGGPIYTYTGHVGNGKAVQAVAWSPNGHYIASGGMEGTVQVWNA